MEISRTDARILGIAAPLRMSGNLQGTPGIRLISPFAELELSGGTIVAQRHIHMSPLDALILRVSHGDSVAVAIEGSDRRLIFDNVAVRVAPDMRLEMHIDTTRPMRQALTLRKPGNAGDEAMNHAMLQRIVEEVAARLRRRALSTATLSVAQLGEADIRSCCASTLRCASCRSIYRCWSSLPASVRWRQPVAHCMRRWLGRSGTANAASALLPALAVKTRPLAADVQRSAWPARQASRRVGAHLCRRSPFQWRLSGARRRHYHRPRPRSASRGMFN